ncbi:MAG: hypothetical protein J6S38_07825, partial [Erysipelotrichaceae bacterium]|nr:hypothetical protein [Erysipelotrichaceae bacterium]
MSYSQNKEEINKVFQLNSLNNRGRFFLRTEDYEGARECFLSVLEIDDKNYDALINLLMIDGSYRSIEELIGHYQNLYTEEESERVIACEFADDQIEELKEKYCIEGYLSEEQIDELFEYKEDIT